MASMTELHRQSFEARLARIKEGGPNCMGQVHVGPRDEVRAKDAKAAKKAAQKKQAKGSSPVATLFLLPVALAIGAFSVFAGRVAAFQLLSADGLAALSLGGVEATLFADIAIAAVLAIILAWTFHMTSGVRRLAVLGGFVAMMTGEVALMQHFPDIFAAFFSETYVAEVLANPPATLSL